MNSMCMRVICVTVVVFATVKNTSESTTAESSTSESTTAESSTSVSTIAGSSISESSTAESSTSVSTIAESSTSVSTIAGSSTSESTTAESSTSVSTIAGSSISESTTAESSTSVSTIAGSSISESSTAESSTSVSTIAESSTSVSTIAGSSTSESTTAESSTSVSTIAGSSISESTTAESSTSESTTAESSTSVSTIAGSSISESSTAESSTSVSTIAESSTSVSTIAGSSTSESTTPEISISQSTATGQSTSESTITESSTSLSSTTETNSLDSTTSGSSPTKPSTDILSSPTTTINQITSLNSTVPGVSNSTVFISTAATTDADVVAVDVDKLIISISLDVSINQTFETDLTNNSSPIYKNLTAEFRKQLFGVFDKSELQGFRDVFIHTLRNGSIVCEFDLQLYAKTNLTVFESQFNDSLESLKNVQVNGHNVSFNSTEMFSAISKVAKAQESGNMCEVYDISYCEIGYSCNSTNDQNIVCEHTCKANAVDCKNGGECFYDHRTKKPACRCSADDNTVYSGNNCETSIEKLALASWEITTIASCVGGGIIVALCVAVAVLIIKKQKSANKSHESDDIFYSTVIKRPDESSKYKTNDMELHHKYDMPMYFHGREHRVVKSSNGAETYLYQPFKTSLYDADYDQHQTSLADLSFPESNFEIRRPSVRQGTFSYM